MFKYWVRLKIKVKYNKEHLDMLYTFGNSGKKIPNFFLTKFLIIKTPLKLFRIQSFLYLMEVSMIFQMVRRKQSFFEMLLKNHRKNVSIFYVKFTLKSIFKSLNRIDQSRFSRKIIVRKI